MSAKYKGYKISKHYNSYDILDQDGLIIWSENTILQAMRTIDQLVRVEL